MSRSVTLPATLSYANTVSDGARFDLAAHVYGARTPGIATSASTNTATRHGAPVFALHGTPSCGAGFDWTDAPRRERNLRVIAPDRPGIGRSTAVPMPAVPTTRTSSAALADALEIDRFAVLGYSGGGPYALAAAAALGAAVHVGGAGRGRRGDRRVGDASPTSPAATGN